MISTSQCSLAYLKAFLAGPLSIRLYANDLGPDCIDVSLDQLQEVVGGGYAPIRLEGEHWLLQGLVGEESAVHPKVAWIFNGQAGFVHGVFILHEPTGLVAYWEPLPTPEFVRQAGDQITVNRVQLRPR